MGGGVCRIRLDARGPDGGAAGFLRAKLVRDLSAGDWWQEDHTSLTIGPEQIGPDWRHFEWTFEVPEIPGGQADFCVFSMSERPIEIRNVSLRRSSWETPIGNDGRLAPGQRVYRKLVELPARRAGDEPVAIYENLLCRTQPERFADGRPDEQTLERLKWYRGELDQRVEPLPALGASVSSPPARPVVLLAALAAAGYATVALMAVVRRGKNRKNISW